MADPRKVAESFFVAVDRHDRDALTKLLDSNADLVAPLASPKGREAIAGFFADFTGAFPDLKHTLTDVVVAGNTVVVEGTAAGTQNAPLKMPTGEVPATGKRVNFRFVDVFKIEGEKIISQHLYFDEMTFLTQLGLAPQAARA